jgi:ABC-type transport system involved in multi-copper enzyme maturation permease subunit/regulation of enolase protein 1 (concanavalin A-like superfamily)
MTTPTITPYQPGTQVGRDRFAQVLRSEWTKFRTVRGWVIGMVVSALVTVVLGLLIAGGGSTNCDVTPTSPGKTGAACVPRVPLGPGGLAVTDQFYFVRQPLAGNGSITVRVTSLTGLYTNSSAQAGPGLTNGTEPWSKAGVIITASTRPGSAYAAMMVTGSHGVRMQYDYTHDMAGRPGAVSAAAPRWLRLTRSGDTITGYDSADGTHWTQVGTARLAGLSSTVQAGLFATSPDHTTVVSQSLGGGTNSGGPTLATGVFDHASLPGTSPGGTWTGDAVGGKATGGALSKGFQGFHQAGGRFTVGGSGDIAPLVPAAAAGLPISTIEQGLVGAFAGLIAVVVVAVMFITAEYRRGMIRTTLAASPRRGRVLAAKAIVAGAVAFAVGLAAALVMVPLGNRLAHAKGSYVLPVTSLTELRVIAGTAALLAVAAVLALAIGTALRRSAGAVTAVIMVIVLPYILGTAAVLPVGAENWLLRVTPAAAFAIQQSMPQYPQVTASYTPTAGYFPLAPWAGLAVLCAWAALALGLALYLLRRRDA